MTHAGARCASRAVLAASLLLSLLTGRVLRAQSLGGTLRGRVRDSSGGAIAGAEITARDTAKGISYPTQSDAAGLYQIALPVGVYDLEADAKNFAAVKQAALTVSLGQTITLDFSLPVQSIQESVEVRAAVPLVDTTSGTLSGLVDRAELQALPLNGRDFGQLALLEPGVVPDANGTNAPYGGKWANFVVNGQLDQATLFLIDGSEINDLASGRNPSGSSGVLLGLEAVQEFQVLLNNYKAEFGKNSGGVIHVVTRSGTNRFHGSAFEYLRNSTLDARNFFDRDPLDFSQRSATPPFRRNQFGASLGGPLKKDETFFFLDYEGLRERKTIPTLAVVPSETSRAAAVPAVVPFLNLYPLPNVDVPGTDADEFIGNGQQPAREDFGLARVDHRLPRDMSLTGKFSIQDSDVTAPFLSTPVPGFQQELPHRIINTLIGLTSALSPNALNEAHFAFNRTYEAIDLPPAPDGLSITPAPGRNFGIIAVTGFSNLGTQTFVPRAAQNLFETTDNFSYRHGRHSQKYGISIQRYQDNELRGTFFNGQYSFAGLPQFLAGSPAVWLGVLGGSNAGGSAAPAGWRWTTYSAFAQDDFQAFPSLTLNLGIRYEFSTSPAEVNGHQINLRSPLDPAPTTGQMFNTIARSWAPRFGFAWTPPFASGRAVLRGGFGIFYNPLVVNMWGNSALIPPFVDTVQIAGGPPFPNPLATGRAPAQSTTGQSINFALSQPYAEQWNVQWEQQLSSNWVVKLGYVGNHGVHIIRSEEANSAYPVMEADGTEFFPAGLPRRNPSFGAIRGRSSDGMSWYDALELSAEKRLSRGWTFAGSYTWSKSLSTNDSSFTTLPSQPSNSQDPDNPFADKGLSAFDTPDRLVFHFIYQLPTLANAGSWVQDLLGSWSLAGIGSFSSGLPFTVVDGFNQSRNLAADSVALADRPDVMPGVQYSNITQGVSRGCGSVAAGTPVRTADLWFDPCAFVLQQPGFFGDAARNALIGPRFADVDLSISKSFRIRESQSVEFRSDFFNLLNHPNLATPSSPTGSAVSGGVIVFPSAASAGSPTGGQIFRTVADSRQMQFSLRYQF